MPHEPATDHLIFGDPTRCQNMPIRVYPFRRDWLTRVDASCRLVSGAAIRAINLSIVSTKARALASLASLAKGDARYIDGTGQGHPRAQLDGRHDFRDRRCLAVSSTPTACESGGSGSVIDPSSPSDSSAPRSGSLLTASLIRLSLKRPRLKGSTPNSRSNDIHVASYVLVDSVQRQFVSRSYPFRVVV
jgi:hypothetical protein